MLKYVLFLVLLSLSLNVFAQPHPTGLIIPPDIDLIIAKGHIISKAIPDTTNLPRHFDWREQNGVTPIKDQLLCGSCWAFATIGVVESAVKIKEKIDIDLSEQWLVSHSGAGTCAGGWFTFDSFIDKPDSLGEIGGVLEKDLPYVGVDLPYPDKYERYIRLASYSFVYQYPIEGVPDPSILNVKAAIRQYGPIGTTMYAGDKFQQYTGGIFSANENPETQSLNHTVVLIGWDDDQGVWLVKNSWGENWGEKGYARVTYGASNLGKMYNYFVVYTGPPIKPLPTPAPTFTPIPIPTPEPTVAPAPGPNPVPVPISNNNSAQPYFIIIIILLSGILIVLTRKLK